MKKHKWLICLLAFIFVLPIFNFACSEVKFEDVQYVLSGASIADVIETMDSARTQAISTEVKMKLQTNTKYTFRKTTDNKFSNKVIQKDVVSVIGKDRDDFFFSNEELTYENNSLISKATNIYEKQTENYVTRAYHYGILKNYGENESEEYVRERFDYSPTTSITNFYTDIVKRITENEFEAIYEKSFKGITYYKFLADVNQIKNRFTVNKNVFESPELFEKESVNDYIMPFSCEVGLKETSGTVYVAYFKVDYPVYNTRAEKYLEVSSVTYLQQYGEDVNVLQVEDKGEHVARAFVDTMKKGDAYCVFNVVNAEGNNEETTFTTVQIQKEDSETSKIYFDYSTKAHFAQDDYYYKKGSVNSIGNVEYTTYKIDNAENKKWSVNTTFENLLQNFNFNLQYVTKNVDESFYAFGEGPNQVKVYVQNNDIISYIQCGNTKLYVQSYGIYDNNLDIVYNVEGYTETTV